MADNRKTVGYVVISRVHGGLSWNKAEGFLCNTDPTAQVFPTRDKAITAIQKTVAFARLRRWARSAGWRRDDYDVVRCVEGR